MSATGGGSDLADLSDTPGNDVLVGRTNWFQLLVPGAEVRGTAFERVRATSSLGGADTVDVSSVDYIFERIGNWIG